MSANLVEISDKTILVKHDKILAIGTFIIFISIAVSGLSCLIYEMNNPNVTTVRMFIKITIYASLGEFTFLIIVVLFMHLLGFSPQKIWGDLRFDSYYFDKNSGDLLIVRAFKKARHQLKDISKVELFINNKGEEGDVFLYFHNRERMSIIHNEDIYQNDKRLSKSAFTNKLQDFMNDVIES